MIIIKDKKPMNVFMYGEPGCREAIINNIIPRYFGNRYWIKLEYQILDDPMLNDWNEFTFPLKSDSTIELLKALYTYQGIPDVVDINDMVGKIIGLYFGYSSMSGKLVIRNIKPKKKFKNKELQL